MYNWRNLLSILLVALYWMQLPAAAQEKEIDDTLHLSYIYEVYNQLYLSDFQLGSHETIRDTDGKGTSFGFFIKSTEQFFLTLDFGYSHTRYQGQVEDDVNIDFSPQEGTGFEALSSSSNVVYDVDLEFYNPFIGITYTNWILWELNRINHTLYPWPSTLGFGVIQQQVEGEVVIRGIDDIEIARAEYEPGARKYFSLGWSFKFDFLYMSLQFRNVEAPVLKIISCNEEAIGTQACERVFAASGNRNNSTQVFTGGLLVVGLVF